jgi:phosphopantothenoylcysteine decarboxylase/phosphopantothenate--cysteine ligase
MGLKRAARAPAGRGAPRRPATRRARRTSHRGSRRKLHVLVTAGPTREHVDPVRFLSNESSGRMGFAIAEAAARRGHRVTLIAGPVALATPRGVERIDVVSARQMLAAARRTFRFADALVMAAAVADYRPRGRLAGKWRVKDGRSASAELQLVRNPDILAALGREKARGRAARPRIVIGFALETSQGERRARSKLERKNADWIVLNDASALNADRASVTVFGSDGRGQRMRAATKRQIAEVLVDLVERQESSDEARSVPRSRE